jgi:hypothetical protein
VTGHVASMKLIALICAKKAVTDHGKWKDGEMPRSAFPLSRVKSKAYKLGNRRWRVLCFEAEGKKCRLLINYSSALGQYQAMLGVDHSGDTRVVARLERHPTHGGWHAHVACDTDTAPLGVKGGLAVEKLAGNCGIYKRPIPDNDAAAFNMAVDFFKLHLLTSAGGFLQ